jgi:hypothetical protein
MNFLSLFCKVARSVCQQERAEGGHSIIESAQFICTLSNCSEQEALAESEGPKITQQVVFLCIWRKRRGGDNSEVSYLNMVALHYAAKG